MFNEVRVINVSTARCLGANKKHGGIKVSTLPGRSKELLMFDGRTTRLAEDIQIRNAEPVLHLLFLTSTV